MPWAVPPRDPVPRALLDYDAEAGAYDATRGGVPRAEAAAAAVLGLLPPVTATLLDLGCGTGIVTTRIAATRPGLRVLGLDTSHGMAAVALARGSRWSSPPGPGSRSARARSTR